jgi:elongation factor G
VASFDAKVYQSGEPSLEGIVDVVEWKAFRWKHPHHKAHKSSHDEMESGTPEEMLAEDHPLHPIMKQARADLIDLLSVHSPPLLDEFLALSAPDPYQALPPRAIIPHLRDLTLRKEILPVFCGSALHHIGTKNLMNYIGELLASPMDVRGVDIETPKPGSVTVLAWKVGWDRQKGWMTFVRVYGGMHILQY